MDTRQALLNAVLANPDDDAPRLIYADWLDENGECERAEFIRVQVEWSVLDKKIKNGAVPEVWERHLGLSTKSLNFLEENPEWGYDLAKLWKKNPRSYADYGYGGSGKANWQWQRGFVYRIALTSADWLAHADAITREHPIREVELTTLTQRFGDIPLSAALRACWPRIKFTLPRHWLGFEPNGTLIANGPQMPPEYSQVNGNAY